LNQSKMLAITRQSAHLRGTQLLLHASGIELVDAANMKSARRLIQDNAIKGIIVCLHSWSEPERSRMVSELAANHPKLSILVRCPGCSRCGAEDAAAPATCPQESPVAAIPATSIPATPIPAL
jgi:hypothetical protein